MLRQLALRGTTKGLATRASRASFPAGIAFGPFSVAAQIEGIEWIILLIIIAVLFLFGPSKIPDLAKGIGRAMGEFKRGRMEVERDIHEQAAKPVTASILTSVYPLAEENELKRLFCPSCGNHYLMPLKSKCPTDATELREVKEPTPVVTN